ncbi:MAG: hypothetical protein K0R54_629 [Clostridiaceae bacterium]|jgi:putative hydrolase of HD superfamily|nr:hypothetical protein [Clostridiaceae bacterium]
MPFGTYIYESRRLMSIKRYQNKFRHKKRTVADHQWATMRIAQGLALWQIECSNEKVDLGDVLTRSMLHDVLKVYTGDIQSNPKNKEFMADAFSEVKEIVYDTNFKQMLPQSWQKPFRKYIINAKDDSIEGKLVQASNIIDKIIECVEEIELGNKRYFENVLIQQTERLIELDLDVAKWFVAYCLKDLGLYDIKRSYGEKVYNFIKEYKTNNNINSRDYEETLAVYLYNIRDLMNTERYQNLNRHTTRNVSQHEWSVSVIAHGLALWEMNKFGNYVDIYELLSTTLVHDTPEYEVGDVLSGVKRTTQRMLESVENREEEAFDTVIVNILPKSWHKDFRRKMLNPKSDTIEGKIVSASDIIDTILESVEEIKLGNEEYFKGILQNVTENLIKIDLPSVRYFLQYSLNDFGLDIKTYYGDKVFAFIKELQNKDC